MYIPITCLLLAGKIQGQVFNEKNAKTVMN